MLTMLNGLRTLQYVVDLRLEARLRMISYLISDNLLVLNGHRIQ
jgi:hypothetical protein